MLLILIFVFQDEVKGNLLPLDPDLARDAELERLRRERVEMDERTQRAHEELVALRRRVRQNEEEAAQDRVQAEKDLKEVRDRLLAAQEEAEKAAKESEINVSVDPALVAQDDSGIDDDLFADIIIPHLFDEFDHEEVIENFNPDLFDLC